MNALILRLDVSGAPMHWISWQNAISLYIRERVAWVAGDQVFTFRGGRSRCTGLRSQLQVNSIIAIKRAARYRLRERTIPPLTNSELFLRDANLCLYCGKSFPGAALTRDHVLPMSRGGRDRWSNVVTACRSCNTRKGNRRPEEAGMRLLAIPYVPNWAEYLALSNRRILADQMDFLKSRFSARRHARDLGRPAGRA